MKGWHGSRSLIWIMIIALVLTLCACGLLVASWAGVRGLSNTLPRVGGGPPGDYTEAASQRLDVKGPVNLRLVVPAGDVTVQADPSTEGQVVVEATKHVWAPTRAQSTGQLANMKVNIRQEGDVVSVEVLGIPRSSRSLRSPRVDLTLSVPPETALSADVELGRLHVNGTHGNVDVQGNVGDVVLNNVMPAGKVSVNTRLGTVALNGPLAPNASYELNSDVGRITVTAPASSSFALDARSDVGNVRVNFPLTGQEEREGILSKEARGTVGADPKTELRIYSRIGDISVVQAP